MGAGMEGKVHADEEAMDSPTSQLPPDIMPASSSFNALFQHLQFHFLSDASNLPSQHGAPILPQPIIATQLAAPITCIFLASPCRVAPLTQCFSVVPLT